MDSVLSETLASEPPPNHPPELDSRNLNFSPSETLAYSSQQPLPSSYSSLNQPPSSDQNPPQNLVPHDQTSPPPPPPPPSPPAAAALAFDATNPNTSSEPELPNPNLPHEDPTNGGVEVSQASADKDNSGGEEATTSSRRRRRSRWDPPPESEAENGDTDNGPKKRKSRWADDEPKPAFQLPDFMKDFIGGLDVDPEIQALNARLLEISRMLQSNLPLDDRPEGGRSPSPEPVYDNLGIRINTREYRARERLNKERQDIISQIIKRNPAFKPPADYRPPKLHKKLYIPMKEYPGYNFIGLIIGPRGNTQKRMEKETGAKIVIRGKGSIKEGRLGQKKDLKFDPAENEDLHVLVEADTQDALDAAAGMVEKLLQPVDEVLNEHKRQQLRELAALNGTIREDEFCRLCGEPGHRQYACPARMSTFKSDVLCKICGDGGHPTIDCPVKGTTGKKMDDEYQNFLAELGGTIPESVIKQSTALPIMGSNNSGSNPPWAGGSSAGGTGSTLHPGLGSNVSKIGKEIDDTNLYIGYLPPTFEDDALIQLFSPFGDIVMAKVIKDRVSGLSKGYGFVKYSDISQANQAIAQMNGHRLEGRMIAVRVAGKPPQPAVNPGAPVPPVPSYTGPNQAVNGYPPHQNASGPFGSAPPGSYMGASIRWGPPAPPPYASYAPPPPPPGSHMYTLGQPMPPYGVQYPPLAQAAVSGAPQQNMPSGEAQQSYPPGVPTQNNTTAQSATAYGNTISAMPPNSQTAYHLSSLGYPSYYAAAPPLPAVSYSMGDQQSFASAPWASNQPVHPPIPSAEPSQQASYGADSEYEKFMAEMK
ncbi:unnamed protein product [Ilex paraguariensis]|uniref:Branchpoint-bridging protein n=1 Tax=Ilex paraguariensis TaxID=185542 RepID=A0ABC8UVG8_9AQUA